MIIKEEFKDADPEGLFSGWDPDDNAYDIDSWGYDDTERGDGRRASGAGRRRVRRAGPRRPRDDARRRRSAARRRVDAGRALRLQILRRHFARYTPELVAETCGCSKEDFLAVAQALCENSGRERTSSIVYAVGWTQHTVGVQNIRAAAIVQLLLGNIGRPGGGILALRGHANIQGSTDIPTLYNILPGYIPMPHPQSEGSLDRFVELNSPDTGVWGNLRKYMVSFLKAWWGDAATAENDYCIDYLPRINGRSLPLRDDAEDARRGRPGDDLHRTEPHRRLR